MKVFAAALIALLAFACAEKTEPATTSSSPTTTDTAPVSHETVDAVHEKGAAAKSTTE